MTKIVVPALWLGIILKGRECSKKSRRRNYYSSFEFLDIKQVMISRYNVFCACLNRA
jgi:hypothetical protein